MSGVTWVLISAGALTALAVGAFLLLGRGRLPSSRVGRLARIGRLWAGLSASWFGARVRRLFAGKTRRERIDGARREADAKRIAATMGDMKGAFMKIGQMMSFISEAIPPEMRAALKSLQAEAPPMDFALIRDVAERELGKPLERAFARFDEKPLASASIGQVHRARLPSGEEVVVKIQYPGVAEAIRADMANVGMLYRMIGLMYPATDAKAAADEIRDRITEELDYAKEAANQRRFGEIYAGHPHIRIPRVIDSHSTARVLTSEFVSGRKFEEVLQLSAAERSHYGEVLYRFVFGSIIHHQAFNGDPHPGNYIFGADGTVVFLDFGCVKYFPDEMTRNWQDLVRAHLEGNKDAFRAKAVALTFIKEDADISAELLYEYFGYYYEPFRFDRTFTFTTEYNQKSFKMVFAPEGQFAGMSKKMNMPADFVFVNRIHWGVFAILAQLGASGNWHRIQRDFLYGDGRPMPAAKAVNS